MDDGRESLHAHLLLSLQYKKKKDFTCKLTVGLNKIPHSFCLSQEIESSIHCEVLWFITTEGRRPGEGHNSDGAVQGKLDETHFPES